MKPKTVVIILSVILVGIAISGCTRTSKDSDGTGIPDEQEINASTTPYPKDENPLVNNTPGKQITQTPSTTPTSSPIKTYGPTTSMNMSIDEIKKKAIAVKYVDLSSNNQDYAGKIVYFRGEVFEMIETDSKNYTLLVYITKNKDLWMDQVWINNNGEKFLETDIIDVWAKVKGLRSYTSSMGNIVTIPEVDPLYIELVLKAG